MATEQNLKQKIYTAIYQSILNGSLPTDGIIREKSLAEQYQVSKSPVREALVELCNEGVLRSLPRYGYQVVRLTTHDVKNIIAFRIILESGCLEQGIEKIQQEDFAALEKLDYRCSQGNDADFWQHWEANKDFHLQLIAYADNAYAYNMLAQALATLTRAYAQFYWDKWERTKPPTDTKYHAAILEAIAEKNMAKARRAIEQDLGDFRV
jgi:DNA-binding GntR family transcriptional regulator